jgi:hypothetical protein
VTDRYVFWIQNPGDQFYGQLWRAGLDGRDAHRVVSKVYRWSAFTGADGLASDGRYLYFTNRDAGTISRMDADGSRVVVYWTHIELVKHGGHTTRIGRVQVSGKGITPAIAANENIGALALSN